MCNLCAYRPTNILAMVFSMYIAIILTFDKCIAANMSGFIVGGEYSFIKQFPHSAFLEISCSGYFACGASILNQRLLLTAAHCVYHCRGSYLITVHVGDVLQKNGISRRVDGFRAHVGFSYESGAHDIAVAKLKRELVFGENVGRVALLRDPPYDGPAFISGWGLIDQESKEKSIYLKHTSQEVWDFEACSEVLEGMPVGCFCAENRFKKGYPSKGDSGGALIIRNVIQIGVVSHEDMSRPTLRIYTNVTHYYDWIQTNSQMVNCKNSK